MPLGEIQEASAGCIERCVQSRVASVATLVARWLHVGCTLVARWLHVGCTLVARWLHVGCTLVARWLHVGCTLVAGKQAVASARSAVPVFVAERCEGNRRGVDPHAGDFGSVELLLQPGEGSVPYFLDIWEFREMPAVTVLENPRTSHWSGGTKWLVQPKIRGSRPRGSGWRRWRTACPRAGLSWN